ncbi:hypothetical protein [Lentibacillus cibarius]|nr:hypothetical protein [Lentibacillus cibarius]
MLIMAVVIFIVNVFKHVHESNAINAKKQSILIEKLVLDNNLE